MSSACKTFTQQAIDSAEFKLIIDQPLFSKARPRLTRSGHAYMPPAYKEAQRIMKKQLIAQWAGEPLHGPFLLAIQVHGEGRGDIDNIVGAFMDAAQGIVFVDDRVTEIPELVVCWEKASKIDSQWIIGISRIKP